MSTSASASSPPFNKAPEYLLILDFEATCDVKGKINEIIEFPTLLYDVKERKVIDTFAEYVKPVRWPVLTPFCIELTGIEQKTVDACETFPAAWKRFNAFLTSHQVFENPDDYAFLTCGAWDLKTMLPSQLDYEASVNKDGTIKTADHLPPPYNRVINVKDSFRQKYVKGNKAPGMAGMLQRLKLELVGRHHSGIDDCKNIARIVQKMQEDGWVPEVNMNPMQQHVVNR